MSFKMRKFKRYKKQFLIVGTFALLLGWNIVNLKIRPMYFLEGIPHFINLVREMIPPDWKVFVGERILWSILETISMAFVGTAFSVLLSFPLGLFAATNLAPSKMIRNTSRGIIAATRVVPVLVLILVLVVVVGLGPFAGVMALTIHSIGMLGKLFAEAVEQVDPKPLESMESVGATKSQIIRYSVLPQVMPSFIANTLYRFDINIRAAIFLGVVGGGGVGYELHKAMRLFRYPEALAVTVLILVVLTMSEKISDILRKRIIGQEVLQ